MRKRGFAAILAVVMMLSLLPATAMAAVTQIDDTETYWNDATESFRIYDDYWADLVTVQPEGYAADTEAKTVTVSTPEALVWFGKQVNTGSSFAGYTVSITADLDLSGHYWTPIDTATIAYSEQDGKVSWTTVDPQKKLDGVTIDGGGHTITGLATATGVRGPAQPSEPGDGQNCYYYSAFIGRNDGALTIKDLSFDQASIAITEPADGVASNGTSMCAVVTAVSSGALTMEGVNVSNAKVLAMQKASALLGMPSGGSFTVEQCAVTGCEIQAYFQVAPICGYVGIKNFPLTVDGIRLENNNTTIIKQAGWNYQTYGDAVYYGHDEYYGAGKWYVGASESAVLENQSPVTVDGNTYSGKATDLVAEVNGYQYATLDAAMSAAGDGDTVTVLKDITASAGNGAASANNAVRYSGGKTITVDFNGHTLTSNTANAAIVVVDGAESQSHVTLRNGTIVAGPNAYCTVLTDYTAQVIVENMTLNNSKRYGNSIKALGSSHIVLKDAVVANSQYGGGVEAAGGTVDIYNSTFRQSGYHDWNSMNVAASGGTGVVNIYSGNFTSENYGMYIFSSGGTINVYGGTFAVTGDHALLKADIDSSSYPDGVSTINVYGGNFTGGKVEKTNSDKAVIAISGGNFTDNLAAYAADGYTMVNETKVIDGVTYYYTVAERAEEIDVETAVSAGAPSVEVDEGLGLTEDFGTELTNALKDADTAKDLTNAAAGLSNDAGVIGTEEAAEKALTDAGISIESATVTVVVEPYLKVEVTGYETGASNSMTLDIGAFYHVKATTDPDNMTDANTVPLREGVPMNVTSPMTITIPLPQDFTDASTLYVKHVKDGGKTYYHLGTVSGDALTFTNTKGFSTFIISADAQPAAEIDGVGYTTLQEAVDEVANGQTVKLLKDDLAATVAREVSFRVDENGHTGLALNADSGYSRTVEGDVYTFTRVGSGSSTYSITVEKTAGGSVKTTPAVTTQGSSVTITVTPDEGYVLESLTAVDKNGNKLELTDKGSGKYTFKMPASSVTVKAVFTKDGTPAGKLPFTDVAESAWYYDAVSYVYEKGIMTGTNDGTTFSPAMNLTRGMMARILYNLEGSPDLSGENLGYPFADVPGDAWYADGVYWARQNGIVNGYGNNTFGPEDPITREQMALLLYNYVSYKGGDLTASADLSTFSDGDRVSDWAEQAMKWAVGEGLINGSNNSLNPLGTATRAEVAQLFMNLLK